MLYGEIVLKKRAYFLVKWYNNPLVLFKYLWGTTEALEAIYKVVASELNQG